MRATTLNCPNCGAALPVGDPRLQKAAICLYCDTSALLHQDTRPTLPPRPPDDDDEAADRAEDERHALGRRVKELVAAGKWKEAVASYAEATGATEAEAGVAIEALTRRLPGIDELLRLAPINIRVLVPGLIVLGGGGAGLALSLPRVIEGSAGFGMLAALCALLIVLFLRWVAPKLVSTWVYRLGPEGRGTILRRAVVSSEYVKGGVIVIVHFQVVPAHGDATPFEDEEALVMREDSAHKLEPGNVLRVRFSRRTGRVFPTSPIEVLETASSAS